MSRLLFIDPDERILTHVGATLRERRREATIVRVGDGTEAIKTYSDGTVDLIVMGLGSWSSPGPAELLLHASANHPRMQMIVVDPEHPGGIARTRSGALCWAGLETAAEDIVDVIGALLDRVEGFQARLEQLTLEDLLTFIHAAGWTGTLHVRVGERSGALHMQNGSCVDATFGERVGLDALVEATAHPEGTIVPASADPTVVATISQRGEDLVGLVLERAAVRREELERRGVGQIDERDISDFLESRPPERAPTESSFDLFTPDEVAEIAAENASDFGEFEPPSDGIADLALAPEDEPDFAPPGGKQTGDHPVDATLATPPEIDLGTDTRETEAVPPPPPKEPPRLPPRRASGSAPILDGPIPPPPPAPQARQHLQELAEFLDDVLVLALVHLETGDELEFVAAPGVDLPQIESALRGFVHSLAAMRIATVGATPMREFIATGPEVIFMAQGHPDADVALCVLQESTGNPALTAAECRRVVVDILLDVSGGGA